MEKSIAKGKLPDCVSKEVFDSFVSDYSEAVVDALRPLQKAFSDWAPRKLDDLATVFMSNVAQNCREILGDTGIVISGYGDHDIFPSMVQFTSCGFLGSKHIVQRGKPISINGDTAASLEAFAQTSMTDTFSIGLSGDVYANIKQATKGKLEEFARSVATALGGDIGTVANLEKMITKAQDEVGLEVLKRSRSDHGEPLRRVLSVLPIEEMAELAETLINLQSLKEKVTKPSETVGGPVDVAVITRHEGLVWIKRKHYFSSEFNSRFALRQAAEHR